MVTLSILQLPLFMSAVRFCQTVLVWTAVVATASATTYHVSIDPLDNLATEIQFRDVQSAVAKATAGDQVLIHAGTYRQAIEIESSGTAEAPITIRSVPGHQVILSGADVLTDWRLVDPTAAEAVHVADWDAGPEWLLQSHPDEDYHRLPGQRFAVFGNQIPLRQVLQSNKVTRGSFYVDAQAGKLYFQTVNNNRLVNGERPVNDFTLEVTKRDKIVTVRGNHVHLSGLTFTKAGNRAQVGALMIQGDDCHVDGCRVTHNNSQGIYLGGQRARVTDCVIEHNGQLGFSATLAHDSVVSDCLIAHNGWKGWSLGWEAGGNKIAFSKNFTVQRCEVTGNRGSGIWYDIDNRDCTVRQCYVHHNQAGGIFYEISYRGHLHDNILYANGITADPASWAVWAGICISSSPGCVVERNLMLGNREGLSFREQDRKVSSLEDLAAGMPFEERKAREKPIWNHDHVVRNNIFAFNTTAQVWGWFATEDSRHLPAGHPRANHDSSEMFDDQGFPRGAKLSDLNLRFEGNVFALADGEFPAYRWGPSWSNPLRLETLREVQSELGLGATDTAHSLVFAMPEKDDFRIPARLADELRGNYPRIKLPLVQTGLVK